MLIMLLAHYHHPVQTRHSTSQIAMQLRLLIDNYLDMMWGAQMGLYRHMIQMGKGHLVAEEQVASSWH
jgi:hypothetical protein